jgi:H+/Na+-translocating ferredoxin:NAD+ oxidoreductase subunit G
MKIVFKIILTAALSLMVVSGEARAQTVYFSTRDLLADFFKKSETVTYQIVSVGAGDRERLEKKLGYALPKSKYTFFVARTGGRVDGYAIIDEEQGEHLPITFAVKLSPDGKVERQEIVAYREPRGDEVRDERFRKQFVGKSAADPVAAGLDIAAVSGATISSRAMAVGVKRALVLFDELVKPTRVVAAGGRPAGSM